MAYDHGLADRVRSILGRRPGFSEKNMFGGVCFMINGNMCCGIVKTDLMVRLAEEQATSGLKEPHTRLMDFSGKPMKSMLYVTAQGCDSDRALERWVESAYTFAARLPPKKEKPAKR
jgi:TfoX/Sxy family transcriptional regulator of competence genes